jgi:hypothetical protein
MKLIILLTHRVAMFDIDEVMQHENMIMADTLYVAGA